MAGYAGFQRARRSTRPRGGMRRSSGITRRMGFKKNSYAQKPRFATVGYTRDIEKKYSDLSLVCANWLPQVISYEGTPGTPASAVVQGVKFMSDTRNSAGVFVGNNLVSFLSQGATATTRIGNSVNGKMLELGLTLEAAKSPVNQGGEQVNVEGTVVTAQYYMKTGYRIVIVRDTQVNNSTNTCSWADVFGMGVAGSDSLAFGANDKLDIPNMGRFKVLSDARMTVDADTPMKNVQMKCYPGSIRYNSGTSPALTNKGYYVLIAQDVLGGASSIGFVIPGNVRIQSRLTFTDE